MASRLTDLVAAKNPKLLKAAQVADKLGDMLEGEFGLTFSPRLRAHAFERLRKCPRGHFKGADDATALAKLLEIAQDAVLAEIDALSPGAGHERIAPMLAEARKQLTMIQEQITQSAGSEGGRQTVSYKEQSPMSKVSPATVFGAPGSVNVKRASEKYEGGTNKRLSYPDGPEARRRFGIKAGHDVTFEGRPVYETNQRQKALAGAFWKHKIASMHKQQNLWLSDEDRDLFHELVTTGEWVGEIRDGNGVQYYNQPKRLSALHQKTIIEDSTSGGTNLVPYFFDVDVVTYPLLYNQLFPRVNLRELNTSNQVKTPNIQNMTIAAGPPEGDSPTISLQSTASLVGVLTSNVYNATGAVTIGRDLLTDTPIEVTALITELYQRALAQFLDKEIAIGDGSTFILGIFNTSSTQTYTTSTSTAGPWAVSDILGIVKTLPKQYRPNPQANVAFVGSDSQYFRIKGISVSTSDHRLIFGYNPDGYELMNRDFAVENDIVGSDLAFLNFDLYRMWRRKGLDVQFSTEGKTLMLANEALIVIRSRWAGQIMDPNGVVLVTNAPLH